MAAVNGVPSYYTRTHTRARAHKKGKDGHRRRHLDQAGTLCQKNVSLLRFCAHRPRAQRKHLQKVRGANVLRDFSPEQSSIFATVSQLHKTAELKKKNKRRKKQLRR